MEVYPREGPGVLYPRSAAIAISRAIPLSQSFLAAARERTQRLHKMTLIDKPGFERDVREFP